MSINYAQNQWDLYISYKKWRISTVNTPAGYKQTGHEKYFKSVQITLTDQNFSFLRRKSMSVKEHTKLTVVNRAISLLCVILQKYICDNFISVYTYWSV